MPFSHGTMRPTIVLRHFARQLDRWTVAREAADCVYNLIVGRSTGRTIVVKRRNERHTETGLQQSDRWATRSCYSVQHTATRSIHIKSPVLYIQVGISRTQDHWSFRKGTPQRLGYSPEHYTCSVMTVPQQNYPISDLAAEPSPEVAHW